MILIGTDFSPASRHATELALLLAEKTESDILLVHAYKLHSRAGMFISMDSYIRKAAEEDMSDFLLELSKERRDHIVETQVIRGYPEEVIMQLDQRDDIGLVVMGTKGISDLHDIFMGRTANTLLNKLNSPILAVPPDAALVVTDKLIFAWDGLPLSAESLDRLVIWAGKIKAPLEVLHVQNPDKEVNLDPETKAGFEAAGAHLKIIAGQGDPKHDIDTYLAESPGAWLALIKRYHGFFEPLFHDSVVRRELFTTRSPLLII